MKLSHLKTLSSGLAAKRAQLHTVAIPSKLTKKVTFEHVDLKVDSMKQINLKQLADGLAIKKSLIPLIR